MLAIAHALVSGAIASTVQNPVAGVSISFLSHPLLDMVPHWDAGRGWRSKTKKRLFVEASLDFGGGFILSYLIFGQHINFWYFLACFIAGQLLDLLQIPYWFFRWNFPPFSWLYRFGHATQGRAKLPWGILTQVVAFVLILLVLQAYSVKF